MRIAQGELGDVQRDASWLIHCLSGTANEETNELVDHDELLESRGRCLIIG